MNEDNKNEAKKVALCLICKSKVIYKYRPFCSSRCAKIDFFGWVNEEYSLDSADFINSEKQVSSKTSGE